MIYIMRHGETDSNSALRLTCRESSNLTDTGRNQARQAADWLADKGITAIYTSHYPRAQETAKIVGAKLKLEPIVEQGLHELDCGEELEGRSDDESRAVFRAIFTRWIERDWDAQFDGGESLRMAYERFSSVLRRIEESQPVPLIITHGGITRAVVPPLCVNAAALQQVHMLSNTAFCVLDRYGHGRYACESWGLMDHLT